MILILAKNHEHFKAHLKKIRYVNDPNQLRGIKESTIIILEDWWEGKTDREYNEFHETIKYLEARDCLVFRCT